MQTVYAIDFETYYDAAVSVDVLGPWLYHRHGDAAAYLVAISGSDGFKWCGEPARAPWGSIAGAVWVSHNASFDELAYMRLGAPGGGPAEWHCTADLAAYLQAPRNLAGAAKELLGMTLDKGARDRMKGVRWSDLNAIGQGEMCEYGQRDADACLALWMRYRAEWPEVERALSIHGRRMMMAGLPVDAGAVAAGVIELETRLVDARRRIPWEGPPLSRKHLAEYCTAEGIPCPDSMAKDDEDFAAWVEQHGEAHPVCRAVGEWRSVNALLEKVCTLQQRTTDGGLYRGGLKYFGAQHTGRWSGGGGFNVQNLPRGPLHGVDLRTMFRATPGYTFVVTDLSQIEPRVLNMLTGNDALMDAIREGWNVYEAFARSIGWEFARGTLKSSNKAGYAMAKAMMLGLGYGMGGGNFVRAAPALTGGAYRPTPADAQRACRQFRDRNPGVVGLWNQMDRHLKDSVKDGTATVELPSGRVIRYFDLQEDRRGVSGLTVRGDKRRRNLYGALLVENVVQATARDIFADGLARLVDAGIDIRLHVHDEAVALCPLRDAEAVKRTMEGLMTTPPEWMPDVPLAAETNITEVYCK